MLAATPVLAGALVLAFSAWKLGGLANIDPILYGVVGLPVVVGLILLARTRKNLFHIACVAEAVTIANEPEVTEAELLVTDPGSGPANAWNSLVHSRICATQLPIVTDAQGAAMDAGAAVVALESHPDAICIVDAAGRVVLHNTSSVSVLADGEETLIGKDLRQYLEGDSLASFEDVLSGRVQRRVGVDIVRENGMKTYEEILRMSVAPIKDNPDVCASVIVHDVTRQRLAERSRHDFLAQATHELRTPLTNIRLYVDEAIEAGEEDHKCRAEALNVISSESLRLERIVSELLDISELEAGARSMDRGDVRIEQLLEDLEKDFASLAANRGVSLTFDLPPKIPVLHGDRDKIAATLHNLVGNAIKYTPSGGSVVVRAEDEESILRIAIEDTGIGIAPEEQEKVYEKFFRSDDSRVSDIEGTGLGLAFARQVAQMHGGELHLDSELNKGSTFTLSMPKPRLAA